MRSLVFLALLSLAPLLHARRGYLFTSPKKLLTQSSETVCTTLYNVTGTVHVKLDLLHADKDDVIATTNHTFTNGTGGCFKTEIPSTSEVSGRLHLQMTFEDHYDYVVDSVKQVLIESNPLITFIETDKPVYKPGQEVKFRVMSLKHDLIPDLSEIYKIWIESPSEVRLAQWLNVQPNQGLVQLTFQLSAEPQQGFWKINVIKSKSMKKETQTFEVKEYVLPKFEVIVTPPDYIQADSDYAVWKICAKYSYGEPVKGDLHVKVEKSSYYGYPPTVDRLHINGQLSKQDGCFSLNLTSEELSLKSNEMHRPLIKVFATVTETGTNVEQNATNEIHVKSEKLILETYGISDRYFTSGLPYIGKVKVKQLNNSPAPNEKIQVCMQPRFPGSWRNPREICKNFTSDSNGNVEFIVPPQKNTSITGLSFVATATDYPTTYFSPEKNWLIRMQQPKAFFEASSWYSPSQTYIQIIGSNKASVKCNTLKTFDILYTTNNEKRKNFYYLVKSRGDIIKMGLIKPTKIENLNLTKYYPNVLGETSDIDNLIRRPSNQSEKYIERVSFPLKIEPRMSPSSFLILYFIEEDGEIVATTRQFDVEMCFDNKVNARFSDEQQFPGLETSLIIEAAPESLCAVSAVDKSVTFLGESSIVNSHRLFKELERFKIDEYSSPRQADDWDYCSKQNTSNDCTPTRLTRSIRFPGHFGHGYAESKDAMQAFDDFGAVVMTDLDVETRICQRTCFEAFPMEFMLGARAPQPGMAGLSGAPHFATAAVPQAAFAPDRPMAADAMNKVDSDLSQQKGVEVRSFFPETWLWELVFLNNSTSTELKRTIPHTVTEWISTTTCLSVEKGLGISPPVSINAFQPFFLDYTLPYSVKRGEVLVLKVSIFNYLQHDLPIELKFQGTSELELLSNTSHAHYCIEGRNTVVHDFRITALAIGDINITVSAEVDKSNLQSCGPDNLVTRRDVLIKPILVKPEGFPVEQTKSAFVCASAKSDTVSVSWDLQLPTDVVRDSVRAEVSFVADLMGPSMQNLDSLVQVPMGCGEQNMILFVPNIHVLNYLNATNQDDPRIKQEAIKNMKTGYQRELNYRHNNGSYSAFGSSDSEGSIWLTAFVVKSFAQAKPYIFIDDKDLSVSMNWIIELQLENGCFPMFGKVIHRDLKGGLSGSNTTASLTAFILISLLETRMLENPTVVTNAVYCLQGEQSTDIYFFALKTYALALIGNNNNTQESLRVLMSHASRDRDLLWWEKPGSESIALSVEMTAYGILSLVKVGGEDNLIEALKAVRWITKHRNANGGFVSTQDTVVALEALAKYSMAITSGDVNLNLQVTAEQLNKSYHVTEQNKLLLHQVPLPIVPTHASITAKGEGCTLMQSSLRYNVHTAAGSNVFSLDVSTEPVASVDQCSIQRVRICLSYLVPGQSSNMAVLEVGMVSGFMPKRASLHELNALETSVKRWEEDKDKVVFYFDELTNSMKCLSFLISQETQVENPVAATVKLFDYYQPEMVISKSYSSITGCSSEMLPHPEAEMKGQPSGKPDP